MKSFAEKTTEDLKRLASSMAVNCVRNTIIESYHAGIVIHSLTGDFTDVKVVTPYGEIPWNEVSKISDKEMMAFNKEVVNNVYSFLHYLLHPEKKVFRNKFMEEMDKLYPQNWDDPKLNESMKRLIENHPTDFSHFL